MRFGGYVGRFVRIDLSTGKIAGENIPEDMLLKYIGGSSLGAKILYDETGFDTDPLGPENLLIFMTGPLTGTAVPSSGRHGIIAKSPLTGIFAESDAGGFWGTGLKRAGFDGVIIKGKSPRLVYIFLHDGQVEILDAGFLAGRDCIETDAILKQKHGLRIVVSCIGEAGEKLVKFASIMHDGKHGRAAGRAGLGAVMGSKNLKALVVLGNQKIGAASEDMLNKSVRLKMNEIREKGQSMREYGTAGGLMGAAWAGDIPIKNWNMGVWEQAEKLSGKNFQKYMSVKNFACRGCVIACGKDVKLAGGKYGDIDGAGPEYETVCMLGTNCLVSDLEAVAKANELCNRYGIDTISTGSAVAFAMECYEKGLITAGDTGGIALEWGSAEALLEMTRQIGEKRGLGALLGEGVQRAAEEIGGTALEYAVHVKGLDFPAHDPRAFHSSALSYATSNRGACHLAGFTHALEKSVIIEDLGYTKVLDRFSHAGKGQMVAKMQDLMGLFDALKMCKFLMYTGVTPADMLNWFNLTTGFEMSFNEFMLAGERAYNLKRLYNVKCGISRKDDVLPPRMLSQPRDAGTAEGRLPFLGDMLNQYYMYRGWTSEGIPSMKKREQLGI